MSKRNLPHFLTPSVADGRRRSRRRASIVGTANQAATPIPIAWAVRERSGLRIPRCPLCSREHYHGSSGVMVSHCIGETSGQMYNVTVRESATSIEDVA